MHTYTAPVCTGSRLAKKHGWQQAREETQSLSLLYCASRKRRTRTTLSAKTLDWAVRNVQFRARWLAILDSFYVIFRDAPASCAAVRRHNSRARFAHGGVFVGECKESVADAKADRLESMPVACGAAMETRCGWDPARAAETPRAKDEGEPGGCARRHQRQDGFRI